MWTPQLAGGCAIGLRLLLLFFVFVLVLVFFHIPIRRLLFSGLVLDFLSRWQLCGWRGCYYAGSGSSSSSIFRSSSTCSSSTCRGTMTDCSLIGLDYQLVFLNLHKWWLDNGQGLILPGRGHLQSIQTARRGRRARRVLRIHAFTVIVIDIFDRFDFLCEGRKVWIVFGRTKSTFDQELLVIGSQLLEVFKGLQRASGDARVAFGTLVAGMQTREDAIPTKGMDARSSHGSDNGTQTNTAFHRGSNIHTQFAIQSLPQLWN